jgi:hypothetical protein
MPVTTSKKPPAVFNNSQGRSGSLFLLYWCKRGRGDVVYPTSQALFGPQALR